MDASHHELDPRTVDPRVRGKCEVGPRTVSRAAFVSTAEMATWSARMLTAWVAVSMLQRVGADVSDCRWCHRPAVPPPAPAAARGSATGRRRDVRAARLLAAARGVRPCTDADSVCAATRSREGRPSTCPGCAGRKAKATGTCARDQFVKRAHVVPGADPGANPEPQVCRRQKRQHVLFQRVRGCEPGAGGMRVAGKGRAGAGLPGD